MADGADFKPRQGDAETVVVLNALAVRDEDAAGEPKRQHPLDSDVKQELWRKLKWWFYEERERQAHNRFQQAIDADYYDHLQWDDESLEVMRERGQAPLVFNRISLAINWLFGTAMRTRVDWKVHPREAGDEEGARTKTQLLRYVSDVNHVQAHRLMAFKDALKVGIGWLDHGIDTDPEAELLRVTYESWRNVWYDSRWRDPAYKDGRYVFRRRWIDEDVAKARWPDRADVIERCVQVGTRHDAQKIEGSYEDWNDDEDLSTGLGGRIDDGFLARRAGVADAWSTFETRRRRLPLTECWYRVPVRATLMRGPIFNGQAYDATNETMAKAVAEGVCSLVSNVRMQVRYAIWCDEGLLAEGASPFRHNRFPLQPIICYRRDRDGAPYGVVRGMRDAQDDFNKRASKALHILSTRGILFEEGSFEDEDEARTEFARPDFFLAYKKGKEKPAVITDINVAQGHLELMDRDALHMESASGVTNELVAMQTQAVSGRAIEKRQQQGQLTTTEPFEHLRLATQFSGETMLSLIEQYYTAPKTFRIIGNGGRDEFVTVNDPKWNNEQDMWEWINDITARQADFVVGEQDFRESLRQAQYEITLEFLSRLPPDFAVKFLDLAIELSDLENKQEWLKRIRQMNGQPDPDEMKTPEGQRAAAEREQTAQMLERAQIETVLAGAAEAKAKAAKAVAEARKVGADVGKVTIDAIAAALEAAGIAVSMPHIARATDMLLEGAGLSTPVEQLPSAAPQAGADTSTVSLGNAPAEAGAGTPQPALMGG